MEVMKETQSKASSPCLNDSLAVWVSLTFCEFIGSMAKRTGEMKDAVDVARIAGNDLLIQGAKGLEQGWRELTS